MMTKVLVMMPNNPGDVLMALQAIQSVWEIALQEKVIEVHYLVDHECAGLVENSPLIHRAWIQPRASVVEQSKNNLNQGIQTTLEFLREIKSVQFDLSVNLFQGKSTAIIQELIQAPLKRGQRMDRQGRWIIEDQWTRYLFSIPANRRSNSMHVVDIYRRMLRPSPFSQAQLPSASPKPLQLPPFREFTLDSQYICFQVGSAWEGKKWPSQNWTRLIQMINKEYNTEQVRYTLVFIGAPHETTEVGKIIGERPHCLNLCGQTTLINTAGIIKNALLLVCPDTFAMHMAACLQTPVFALFGPSNPIETSPWCPNQFVLSANHSLTPVLDFLNPKYMGFIHSKDVFQLIKHFLLHSMKNLNIELNAKFNQLHKSSWNSDLSQQTLSTQKKLPENPTHPDLSQVHHKTQDLLIEQRKVIEFVLSSGQLLESISEIEQREYEIAQSSDRSIVMESYRIELNSLSMRQGIQGFFHSRLKLIKKYSLILKIPP